MASSDPFAGSMSATSTDPFAGSLAGAGGSPSDPIGVATKLAGGGLKNVLNFGKGALDALEAPARGVAGARQYVDANHLEGGRALAPDKIGGVLDAGRRFAMDPKKQGETGKIVRDALAPEQGGFIPSDTAINSRLSGFPATAARWAAQTTAETLADPVTGVPVGGIGKVAKALGGGKVLEAAGKLPGAAAAADFRSRLFSPEHDLRDLTEHGQNVVAGAQNRARLAAAEAKRAEDAAISTGRKAIKTGEIPDAVRQAFAKYGADVPESAKPSELRHMLDQARNAHASEQTRSALRESGLLDASKPAGSVASIARPTIRRSAAKAAATKAPVAISQAAPKATEAEGATAALLRQIRGQDTYASMVANPSERMLALDAERAASEAAAAKAEQSASVKAGASPRVTVPKVPSKRAAASTPFTVKSEIAAGKSAQGATAQELLRARGQDVFFKDPANIEAAREGVAKHIAPEGPKNQLERAIAGGNSRLKAMYLAVPFPHVGNLTNLSYNKYGLGTTARGLGYAAQEAFGKRSAHLDDLIDQLKKAGADNQYAKLFGETNPLEPVRQVQRFANAAQDKILNPVERGLRASMMERELAGGKTGVDAARNIHKGLGSDADTGMTKLLGRLPLAQFPRFHTQTATGSFGRTLADAPGRVTGFEHAFGGAQQQPDGKPHFHLSTPTAAGLRAADNPLGFFGGESTLGGLSQIMGPYSPGGLALKGVQESAKGQGRAATKSYEQAVQAGVTPLLPASQTMQALYELAKKTKGKARESAQQDLLSSLIGGYWSKR